MTTNADDKKEHERERDAALRAALNMPPKLEPKVGEPEAPTKKSWLGLKRSEKAPSSGRPGDGQRRQV